METVAKLYLNGKPVGTVFRTGGSASWSYGLFDPDEGFGDFAPLFACWASLMHAGSEDREMDDQLLAELRVAECAIDGLAAKLFWVEGQAWTQILQLNIDGRLIEWKSGNQPLPAG